MSYCPIWRTPATHERFAPGIDLTCNSPRTGGRYWITERTLVVLHHQDEPFKTRLTSWLVECRRRGEDCPKVSTNEFDSISKRSLLSLKDRTLNLLVYISRELADPADLFEYEIQVNSEDYYDDQRRSRIIRYLEMLAWSESSKPEQVCTLLDYLTDTGCLERVRGGATLLKYRITATGWEVLEQTCESASPPTRKIGFIR